MSQINNLTGWGKARPDSWFNARDISVYLTQLELWVKQVTENLRGVRDTSAYNVADLPPASDYDPSTNGRASFVYVYDATGGAQMVFSDGTNWRAFTDRAIIA